jgi:PKD repeat protein
LGQPGALSGDANTSVGFNGTSQYVQVPYVASLNPAQFSVEAWAYITGGQGRYRAIVSNRNYSPGNTRGFILYAASDNTWRFWLGTGTGNWTQAFGPALSLNTWTHLVGTFDGTTARFYVNGALVDSEASNLALNAARPLRIASGENEAAPTFFLPGRVDEVAVYGGALSAARVSAHYAAGTGGGGGGNQPPNAVATGSPTSGSVPLTVNFDGSGSNDPDGTIAAYAWDLDGDGQFDDSTVQKPSFQYTSAGTFTVRLQVTDNQGAQGVSAPLTITAGSAPAAGYRDAVLADSPVAYWRLGESSGTSAADASGGGRTGTYFGAPSFGLQGALAGDANTCVGFNGSSQYVQVPYSSALNPTRFSVEAWAYVTGGSGTYRAIVSNRDYSTGNTRGFILYAASDDTWRFWLGNGTDIWEQLIGPTLAPNTWTHLVGTFDGTTARLYVNGTLVDSATMTLALNTARPLRIAAGENEAAPLYLLPGRVDEVAVYGAELPAARVQAHYTAATTP